MKRKKKSLSPREEQLARLMVSGTTAKDACNTVGYKSVTPATKPIVKERVSEILDAQGLSLRNITSKLAEGLNATKIVGSKDDFIEVPDYITRHKYIETLLKLHDAFPSTKHQVEVDTVEARLRAIYSR